MLDVVLILPPPGDWETLKHTPVSGAIAQYDAGNDRHVVEFADGYAALTFDPTIAKEYDSGELDVLPFEPQGFVVLRYSSDDSLRLVLGSGMLTKLWIDDDERAIEPVSEYASRLGVILPIDKAAADPDR